MGTSPVDAIIHHRTFASSKYNRGLYQLVRRVFTGLTFALQPIVVASASAQSLCDRINLPNYSPELLYQRVCGLLDEDRRNLVLVSSVPIRSDHFIYVQTLVHLDANVISGVVWRPNAQDGEVLDVDRLNLVVQGIGDDARRSLSQWGPEHGLPASGLSEFMIDAFENYREAYVDMGPEECAAWREEAGANSICVSLETTYDARSTVPLMSFVSADERARFASEYRKIVFSAPNEDVHVTPDDFCDDIYELVEMLESRNYRFAALNAECNGDRNECTWDLMDSSASELYPSYARFLLSLRSCSNMDHYGFKSGHPFFSRDVERVAQWFASGSGDLTQRFRYAEKYINLSVREDLNTIYLEVDE